MAGADGGRAIRRTLSANVLERVLKHLMELVVPDLEGQCEDEGTV